MKRNKTIKPKQENELFFIFTKNKSNETEYHFNKSRNSA